MQWEPIPSSSKPIIVCVEPVPDSRLYSVYSNYRGLRLLTEGYVSILGHIAQRERFEIFRVALPLLALGEPDARISVPKKAGLLFNAICDPDACTEALTAAEHFRQQLVLPCLNAPCACARAA